MAKVVMSGQDKAAAVKAKAEQAAEKTDVCVKSIGALRGFENMLAVVAGGRISLLKKSTDGFASTSKALARTSLRRKAVLLVSLLGGGTTRTPRPRSGRRLLVAALTSSW